MEFLLILQQKCGLLILSRVGTLKKTRLRAAIWGESGFHTTKKHDQQPLQTFARSKTIYSKWTFGKSSRWIRTRNQDHQSNTLTTRLQQQLLNRWKLFGIYTVTY